MFVSLKNITTFVPSSTLLWYAKEFNSTDIDTAAYPCHSRPIVRKGWASGKNRYVWEGRQHPL